MFHLHDVTRRRVCVVAFLMLGLLPTLLAGGWCLGRYAPGYLQTEAQQLSRLLGLNVKLGGLQHLRPGTVLYGHFEAADPETGQTVFRCQFLEVARQQQTDDQGQRRTVLAMRASQPEVEAASLGRIGQCLARTLEGSCGPLVADVQLSASELTLQAGDNSQTLTNVEGVMEDLPGGTYAQVHFRLAGADTPEPARIRMVRNRQMSPPVSGFEFDTGDGMLPCNVLAMGLGDLQPLGPRCRFKGRIEGKETPNGWLGEVVGDFAELDLGRLVSERYPHRLAGVADVTILSARFCRGRLEEGSAIVVAGPGTIDQSLMTAAVECLGLTPGPDQPPAGDLVPYKELAFLATLDVQGLRLGGRCAVPERAILSDGRRCLLGESLEQSVPAVALARMLVPPSVELVPASRQTDRLLSVLPVPDVMPPAGAAAIPPHARVWVRETRQR
jgi:hypothetical protein